MLEIFLEYLYLHTLDMIYFKNILVHFKLFIDNFEMFDYFSSLLPEPYNLYSHRSKVYRYLIITQVICNNNNVWYNIIITIK